VTGEEAFAVAKLLISKFVPEGGTNVDDVLCLVFHADGKTIHATQQRSGEADSTKTVEIESGGVGGVWQGFQNIFFDERTEMRGIKQGAITNLPAFLAEHQAGSIASELSQAEGGTTVVQPMEKSFSGGYPSDEGKSLPQPCPHNPGKEREADNCGEDCNNREENSEADDRAAEDWEVLEELRRALEECTRDLEATPLAVPDQHQSGLNMVLAGLKLANHRIFIRSGVFAPPGPPSYGRLFFLYLLYLECAMCLFTLILFLMVTDSFIRSQP
jgi:hypothetical protein